MTRAASILAGILAAAAAHASANASARALDLRSGPARPERLPGDGPQLIASSDPDRERGLAAAPPDREDSEKRERG